MSEKAFVGAGAKPGLELWRIEKLAPVKQKVTGKFHTGDSYILLSTSTSKSGAMAWNIHFWLGEETSQDEAGVAAYKTIELDDTLGGRPVQYREVQGHESALFLSYFKSTGGIEYLPGGVESGFRKVERDVYPTRLLHVKGKRTVVTKEVPLKMSSLNKGDVFILDAGFKIYLFLGPTANRFEKAKGIEVAQHINADDRGGRAEIILIHEEPHNPEFWAALGGSYVDPNKLPEGPSDDEVQATIDKPALFQISDASGKTTFTSVPIPDGKLTKELLDSNDVFLLHTPNDLFVWVGRGSTLNEKKEATTRSVQYLTENNLPTYMSIERISEGNETAKFKSHFLLWDPPKSFGIQRAPTGAEDSPMDIAALMSRKAEEDTPVDDGSGKLEVWVIKDFKKVPLDPASYGEFHGGDSYILLYTYQKNRRDEYIIYFWLGKDSTADEKGSAALLSVELDDSLGGRPVQVRVTQGKEPSHFRQLFKGRMVVYCGGHASGFNSASASTDAIDSTALFHVKGTTSLNTMGVQVSCAASSLNSEDSFVLITDGHVHVWQGSGANESENTVATNIATILAGKYGGKGGRLIVQVKEGSEPPEFWAALGGKADYPSSAPGEATPKDARLFSASTATGKFNIEEVDNYDQSDLNDEDVFLLDTFTQLFVWIGTQSTAQEREKAYEFAKKYIAEASDGRDPEMPIVRVNAGCEPAMFTCHFLGWDAEYTKKQIYMDPYQAKLDAMAAEKAKKLATQTKSAPAAAPSPVKAFVSPISKTYPYEALKDGIPDGVDPSRKEEYLDATTFSSFFGMDKASFAALPKWKRDSQKKSKGLF